MNWERARSFEVCRYLSVATWPVECAPGHHFARSRWPDAMKKRVRDAGPASYPKCSVRVLRLLLALSDRGYANLSLGPQDTIRTNVHIIIPLTYLGYQRARMTLNCPYNPHDRRRPAWFWVKCEKMAIAWL